MRNSDSIKRAIAFYFSVLLYIVLLPIVLSYSLGYKIDFKKLKIYKTGIIYVNSSPAGASIYINGKLHPDLTPSQIEELKPDTYRVEVKREGFYAWEKELTVRPNMVTKAERIILFPIMQKEKRILERDMTDFAVSGKNSVYCMTASGLFKSNLDGTMLKRLSPYSDWPKDIEYKKFSPDGDKFLFFNKKTVWVVYLDPDKAVARDGENARVEEVLASDDPILDVFWYSGAGYVIIVTEKYINVAELRGGGKRNTACLYKFNAKPRRFYYDSDNDSIYFTDIEKGSGNWDANYLYRLDLRQTFFDKLIKMLLKREPEALHEKG